MPQSRLSQSWKGALCATLPSSHGSQAEEQRELRADKLIWQSTTLCFHKCSQAKARRELFTLPHPLKSLKQPPQGSGGVTMP